MVPLRKTLKILHTLAACGLIGGLLGYMVLLTWAPQATPAAYADLRQSIAALSSTILVPSLAVALISGLLSMAVHRPYLDKRWAWVKAAMGIIMFKGVLTIAGFKAGPAADLARRIAEGEAAGPRLEEVIAYEWSALVVMLALSVANVVLGVWRPRLEWGAQVERRPELRAKRESAPADEERARPAA